MANGLLPLVLFNFKEGTPGVGTISSIFKPNLPLDESEIEQEVHSLIVKETELMVK